MIRTTKINFSRNWRQSLEDLIQSALRQQVFPGIEVLVAQGENILLHQAWGRLELGPEAQETQPGTVWDIASITKPVATATSLLVLVEQGKVSLEDKLLDFFPAFDTPEKAGITLRHLLTHTSGLPALVNLFSEPMSQTEAVERLIHLPLKTPTGTAMLYGDPNFLLLGEVIRRTSGQTLSEFFHQNVAHPLGLTRTAFHPLEQGWKEPIAPTQFCTLRGQLLRGVVHDENSWVLGGEGGNAGLFSTAPDLHRFARLMLEKGALDDVRILSRAAVEAMTANQNPRHLAPRGLGWDMKGTGFGYMSCGELMATGTIGHTGFTGTSLWMEPDSGLLVIVLTNRVHVSREKNQQDMIRFRPRIHNLLVSVFGE
ncbi:MAG: beta-lactamase family protein [Deltaproteobacteria bacterium]|nr:beta-lactamase family protein [Deltaproteobacteria bacterium]